MRIEFGSNVSQSKQAGRPVAAEWDSQKTINPHIIMLGDSGTGKTHNLRRFIRGMMASSDRPVRFHLFDVHGDIDVPGASTVMFSESTDFGFNPLEVNPDPNFGGVRKRIQSFIAAINRTSRKLGHKQEAVLRYLLTDLYVANGFKPEEPVTWSVRDEPPPAGIVAGRVYLDVPFEEKDRAKAAGAQWDTDVRCWYVQEDQHCGPLLRWAPKKFGKHHPTMLDAVRFSSQRLKAMFLGTSQVAVRYLEDVNRASRSLRAKEMVAMRRGEDAPDAEKLQRDVDNARSKAIEAYTEYVNAVRSGRELDDVIKYDSVEVLKSVVDRLENLNAIGIFRNTPPPFDLRAPVWRYDITALSEDEKKLFVTFRLEAIFARAIQRGVQSDVVEVVVLDEAHLFVSDDPDHILNKLVKEARKFGVAVVLASQAPTHFSDDLISGVATKVLLGLDKFYWDLARRKLGLDEGSLRFIVPKRRMVVQMKVAGELQSNSIWVNLSSPETGALRRTS